MPENTLLVPVLDPHESYLVSIGSHPHPHRILGPHHLDAGVLVRVLRPLAESVTLIIETGARLSMAHVGNGIWEDPYLASVASATKSVCYGDWASALIIKATPIRVDLSSDFLFDKDQIAIKTVQRISLAVQDPAAAAYLVSANT